MFSLKLAPQKIGITPQLPRRWQPPARPRAPLGGYVSKLNTALFHWSPKDPMTLRDLCEGVMVFGGIGSGKTSGSGARIAEAMMRAGFGGLVLCAKRDECDRWRDYAAKHGRSDHLIVVDGEAPWRFNFLEYEMARDDAGGGSTMNVVQFLMYLSDMATGESGIRGSGGDNKFWEQSGRQLISNAIDLLRAAGEPLSFAAIMELAETAPFGDAQAEDPAWQASSYFYRVAYSARNQPPEALATVRLESEDLRAILGYWYRRFARYEQKLRTNIIATVSAIIDPFLKGTFRRLFCTETNFVPEMTEQGAIIVIDLPVAQHGHEGALVQNAMKYFWQKAIVRRNPNSHRPVFLFADEAQYFINEEDQSFQDIARSHRACTVYLTQHLPRLYAQMGGPAAHDRVDSILGYFQCKVFHQNPDHRTNAWAAEMIGKSLQWRQSEQDGGSTGTTSGGSETDGTNYGHSNSTGANGHNTYGASGGSSFSSSVNWGINQAVNWGVGRQEQMDYTVQPAEFTGLLKGGGGETEAIIFQGGRRFRANRGATWLKTRIPQL
jgi:hypothetical protein